MPSLRTGVVSQVDQKSVKSRKRLRETDTEEFDLSKMQREIEIETMSIQSERKRDKKAAFKSAPKPRMPDWNDEEI